MHCKLLALVILCSSNLEIDRPIYIPTREFASYINAVLDDLGKFIFDIPPDV